MKIVLNFASSKKDLGIGISRVYSLFSGSAIARAPLILLSGDAISDAGVLEGPFAFLITWLGSKRGDIFQFCFHWRSGKNVIFTGMDAPVDGKRQADFFCLMGAC